MDCTHQIPLESYLFETLRKNNTNYYLTVYDEKYEQILPGDVLNFTSRSSMQKVTVEDIIFYKFFSEPLVQLDLREVLIDFGNQKAADIEGEYKAVAIKYNLKPNLVLDLDETLVHTLQQLYPLLQDEIFQDDFPYFSIDGNLIVYTRPELESFIEELSEMYNIYIYSNGMHDYVHNVCEKLEHQHKILKIIARKDFAVLEHKHLERWGLDPKKTVIVDDRLDVWDPVYHRNVMLVPRFALVNNMFINGTDELSSLKSFLKIVWGCYNFHPSDIRHYL